MLNVRVIEQQDIHDWKQLYTKYLEFYKTSLTDNQLLILWGWLFHEHEKIYCYIASMENTLVGFVHFREFLRPIKASIGIFMDDLFVDPAYRGQGIAQRLIKQVEYFAQERNSTVVRWVTAEDNHRAMNVYDKLAIKTQWVTYDMAVTKFNDQE